MSWQVYVDSNLVGSGHIDKAAIYDGECVWAASPGFRVPPDEMTEIVAGLNGTVDKLYIDGIYVMGERYTLTHHAEGRSLYARKGKEGITVVKTLRTIIVAHNNDNQDAEKAATTVESVAEYLIKRGF